MRDNVTEMQRIRTLNIFWSRKEHFSGNKSVAGNSLRPLPAGSAYFMSLPRIAGTSLYSAVYTKLFVQSNIKIYYIFFSLWQNDQLIDAASHILTTTEIEVNKSMSF